MAYRLHLYRGLLLIVLLYIAAFLFTTRYVLPLESYISSMLTVVFHKLHLGTHSSILSRVVSGLVSLLSWSQILYLGHRYLPITELGTPDRILEDRIPGFEKNTDEKNSAS